MGARGRANEVAEESSVGFFLCARCVRLAGVGLAWVGDALLRLRRRRIPESPTTGELLLRSLGWAFLGAALTTAWFYR